MEEHGEKDSKKGRREHAALFHSTADWKGIRGPSIEADGAVHVLVEGGYDGEQFRWTADLPEDLEESGSLSRKPSLGPQKRGTMAAAALDTSPAAGGGRRSCPMCTCRL